jgi:hypothetical protein
MLRREMRRSEREQKGYKCENRMNNSKEKSNGAGKACYYVK